MMLLDNKAADITGFCLIFFFHFCGIVCFSCNHWKSVKLYSSLRSSQGFKLLSSKRLDKELKFFTANFVKHSGHTGLSSIWIYLLNHKNCERKQAGVSGLEERCVFQPIKVFL